MERDIRTVTFERDGQFYIFGFNAKSMASLKQGICVFERFARNRLLPGFTLEDYASLSCYFRRLLQKIDAEAAGVAYNPGSPPKNGSYIFSGHG